MTQVITPIRLYFMACVIGGVVVWVPIAQPPDSFTQRYAHRNETVEYGGDWYTVNVWLSHYRPGDAIPEDVETAIESAAPRMIRNEIWGMI